MNELAIPEELKQESETLLTWARSLVIATPEQFSAAGDTLKSIKGASKRFADWFRPLKQAQDQAKKKLLDAEKEMIGPLDEAETLAKKAMLTYQQAEQKKADDERRRLQAIADAAAAQERQKAEKAAERQRQLEREARDRAAKARVEAEQANAAERRKLLAQAEAAERKAEQASIKADSATETAAAVITPVVAVQSHAQPVAGISTRSVWKAEIVDIDKLIDFIFENKRRDLIIINEKFLDATAKALREAAKIPGIRFFSEQQLAAKGR